jgi:hypothetical protein
MRQFILFFFLGFAFTLQAQEEYSTKLDIADIRQEQTNWCWAASTQCVLAYYGYSKEQCEIAEYARTHSVWHNYGSTPCCEDASQGCNKGGLACFEEDMLFDILLHFGNIKSECKGIITTSQIQYYLKLHRPFLIRRVKNGMTGHVVVGYGIEFFPVVVWVMDPLKGNYGGFIPLTYEKLKDDGTWKWEGTHILTRSPNPDHCYNCKLDGDEVDVDCGGSCMPCVTAPAYISFTTATEDLPAETRAIKKITAGNAAVKVLSGQKVDFITSEEGAIVLFPGFEAKEGSNFNMKTKNSTAGGFTRICGRFCKEVIHCSRTHIRYKDNFRIFHLTNAYKVKCKITNIQTGREVFEDIVYVDKNGTVDIWDCVTGENHFPTVAYYVVDLYMYGCDGNSAHHTHKIGVFADSKSLDEESEEWEIDIPLHFSPPNYDNNLTQDVTSSPNFSITPNPNAGTFQLETNFPLSDIDNLKITNTLGIMVYESQHLVSNEIQLQNTAHGLYFVVMVLKDGKVLKQKVMVQR